VQPVHLRGADLTLLARGLRFIGRLRLLRQIFSHGFQYTGASGTSAALAGAVVAGAPVALRDLGEPQKLAETGGTQGLERAVGQNSLDLAQ
jgi:hypothetical protein